MKRRTFLIGMTGLRKRKRKAPRADAPLSAVERRMLLRSFSADALRTELDHRMLTMYSLEELQEMAREKGVKIPLLEPGN